MDTAIVFGPVPSRRLGRSLGINNIPPKHCSYGCRYCQVGPTHEKSIEPHTFYSQEQIVAAVREKVAQAQDRGEAIDYLTFVPDGEPTLDTHLAESIVALRPLGVPIAVISNASLLWRAETRQALLNADWVSVKVDSVDEAIWREVNRPHESLQLAQVLSGIEQFATEFNGTLVSETMLLAGINDKEEMVAANARYLQQLPLACAYLAVPIRPTTDPDVHGPDEAVVTRAYAQYAAALPRTELLIGYEGDAFASSGDVVADILSISAVHPLRKSAIEELLRKNQLDWSVVASLLNNGEIREIHYEGDAFYARRLHRLRKSKES